MFGRAFFRKNFSLLLILWLVSSAWSHHFPYREQLAEEIAFWKSIFTRYSLSQYVIHDSKYPKIIYVVVSFDSTMSERQINDSLKAIKDSLKNALRRLQRLQYFPEKLTDLEKQILKQFQRIHETNKFAKAVNRIRAQQGIRENFLSGVIRSTAFLDYIQQVFRREGLPEELCYLPHLESSFNPKARSHVGAVGMWQFMRSTARLFMRVNGIMDQRLDPFVSTYAAARLLKYNYQQLQDWALAITAYNYGVAGLRRAVRIHGRDYIRIRQQYLSSRFGFASKNFYPEFLAIVEIMDSLQYYFPNLPRLPAMAYHEIRLPRPVNLRQLMTDLGLDEYRLRALNPAYRRSVWQGKRIIPAGYPLRLPPEVSLSRVYAYLQPAPHIQAKFASISPITSAFINNIQIEGQKPAVENSTLPVLVADVQTEFLNPANHSRKGNPFSSLRKPQVVSEPIMNTVDFVSLETLVEKRSSPPRQIAPDEGTVRGIDQLVEWAFALTKTTRTQSAVSVHGPQNHPPFVSWALLQQVGLQRSRKTNGNTPASFAFHPPRVEDRMVAVANLENLMRWKQYPDVLAEWFSGETGLPSASTGEKEEAQLPPLIYASSGQESTSLIPGSPVFTREGNMESIVLGPNSAGMEQFEQGQLENDEQVIQEISRPQLWHIMREKLQPVGNTVVVFPNETIGHFAQWLGISAAQLRRINHLRHSRIYTGQKLKLDFSHTTPQAFTQKRLAFHQQFVLQWLKDRDRIQLQKRRAQPGDNLWTLARKSSKIPLNLLLYFNDLDKLKRLYPGDEVNLPVFYQ